MTVNIMKLAKPFWGMMSFMRNLLSSKEIIKILKENGFTFISQKGSHKKFRKGTRIVIVPDPKKEIPRGTLESILRQSGIDKQRFQIDD